MFTNFSIRRYCWKDQDHTKKSDLCRKIRNRLWQTKRQIQLSTVKTIIKTERKSTVVRTGSSLSSNFSLCRFEGRRLGEEALRWIIGEIHTCIHIFTARRTVLPGADFTQGPEWKWNRLIKAEIHTEVQRPEFFVRSSQTVFNNSFQFLSVFYLHQVWSLCFCVPCGSFPEMCQCLCFQGGTEEWFEYTDFWPADFCAVKTSLPKTSS